MSDGVKILLQTSLHRILPPPDAWLNSYEKKGIKIMEIARLELVTYTLRTYRSRKVVSFLPTDCGVWFDENDRRGAIKNTAFSVPIRN